VKASRAEAGTKRAVKEQTRTEQVVQGRRVRRRWERLEWQAGTQQAVKGQARTERVVQGRRVRRWREHLYTAPAVLGSSSCAWQCNGGSPGWLDTLQWRVKGKTGRPTSSSRNLCRRVNNVYFVPGYTYLRLRTRHICIQYFKMWICVYFSFISQYDFIRGEFLSYLNIRGEFPFTP